MSSYIHIYYDDSTISLRNTLASLYTYFLQHLILSILEQPKYIGSIATKVNPLSANITQWSNTLKQFVGNCRRTV